MEAIIFRVPAEQKNKLKAVCALQHMSMTCLLGELITKYLLEVEEAEKSAS